VRGRLQRLPRPGARTEQLLPSNCTSFRGVVTGPVKAGKSHSVNDSGIQNKKRLRDEDLHSSNSRRRSEAVANAAGTTKKCDL
jgi:hypothetical protein